MKPTWMLVALVAASPLLALTGQKGSESETERRPSRGLVPVPEDRAPAPPYLRDEAGAVDEEEWRAALSDPDLERRQSAYERMLGRARRSAAGRALLEAWAADPAAGELGWTARLMLRELDSPLDPFGALRGSARMPFGSLFQSPFDDEPFPRGLFDGSELFEDLRQQIDSLLDGTGSGTFAPLAPLPPGQGRSRSFELRSGPDGVQVEIVEDEDGEESRRTYEAESLEELLEAHPSLRGELGNVHVIPGGTRAEFDRLLERLRGPLGADFPSPFAHDRRAEPRTDVLGVFTREARPGEALAEGVEPGMGLWIERTVPGTIAHVLELQRGDVLVELNGETVETGEDVSRVLSRRGREEPLRVTIVDRRGDRRTLTWKPSLAD